MRRKNKRGEDRITAVVRIKGFPDTARLSGASRRPETGPRGSRWQLRRGVTLKKTSRRGTP